MRLSCFLACWLTLSAFGTVFSQQKLVNLKVVAESLSNVLMQIKDQTGVKNSVQRKFTEKLRKH